MLAEGLLAARRILTGAAVGIALFGAPQSAGAASYTFTLVGSVFDGVPGGYSSGGIDYQTLDLMLPLGGPPVNLVSGDTITLDLSLDLPLSVPSGSQKFGVNLITDVSPANASTTGTITFSSLAGGPIANPQVGGCGDCLSNFIFTSGPEYSFLGLVSVATYLFDGPVTLNALSISFEVGNPSPAVPLPAALPLFATGLGVMGLLGWRKKRKDAAAKPAA